MQTHNLSDYQWCVLDLLMRSRQLGVDRINRTEMLRSAQIPQSAAVKLTWAALTMPKDLMTWVTEHDFEITDAGVSLYNLRFGEKDGASPTPTTVADSVICLPGPEHCSRMQ
jgi:hypothetical protein